MDVLDTNLGCYIAIKLVTNEQTHQEVVGYPPCRIHGKVLPHIRMLSRKW